MKKRDRKEFERYVRWIANEIGLRDWTFTVEILKKVGRSDAPNRPEGEWGAKCGQIPGRKYGELAFCAEIRGWDRRSLCETVVHELVHCHFAGMWDTLRLDLGHILKQREYWIWIAGVERWMEYGVDACAEAIAPHMPLIEWPS